MNTLNTFTIDPVEQNAPKPDAKPTYGFVSSRAILDVLAGKGWEIDSIQRSYVRKPGNAGFQKHIIWLKNRLFGAIPGLTTDNETHPRLCLVNSHDSSSSLMGFFGLLRVACLNQIATGNVFRHFRAVHSKNVLTRLSQGIDYLTVGLPEVIENVQKLQAIQLTTSQRLEYAKTLVNLRLENVQNVLQVDYSVVECAIRPQDTALDAYTTLNRVQEYLVRGGIPYAYEKTLRDVNGNTIGSQVVNTRTRAVKSIPAQLKLNQALVSEVFKVAA